MAKKTFLWGFSACLLGLSLVVSPATVMAQVPACTGANIAGKYSGVSLGGNAVRVFSQYAFLNILGNLQFAYVAYFSDGAAAGQVLFLTGSATIVNPTSCLMTGSMSDGTQLVARFVVIDGVFNMVLASTPFDPFTLATATLFRDSGF